MTLERTSKLIQLRTSLAGSFWAWEQPRVVDPTDPSSSAGEILFLWIIEEEEDSAENANFAWVAAVLSDLRSMTFGGTVASGALRVVP